jgi:hypothetical protein
LNTKNKKHQDKIKGQTKITMSEMSRNPIDNPLRSKIDTPHTNIHECSLSWLGTSIKSGGD